MREEIKTNEVNFLHKNVVLRSDQQVSAQGSVYFINRGEEKEMILKSVSGNSLQSLHFSLCIFIIFVSY